MSNYNTTHRYMQVHSKDIFVDPVYQRQFNQRKVEKILKEFDPNPVNVPKVSFRDGKYWVFDGQHTVAVLKARNGGEDCMITCKVFYGLTQLDEMELFLQQNGKASPVYFTEKFRALYRTGDPDVTAIVKACESQGLSVSLDGGSRPGRINAVKTLYDSYKALGVAEFTRVLSIIKSAWGGDRDSLSREIITGMTLFYSTFGHSFKEDQLVKRLRKIDPMSIIREGKSVTGNPALGCARVILRHYNSGRKTSTKLEEKL